MKFNEAPSVQWCAFSLLLSCVFAVRGLKKHSLSSSGALAALCVGTVHMSCGLSYGLTLIAFYVSSSQVLANSLGGCCLALVARLLTLANLPTETSNTLQTFLYGAFLGHYACCCADTWASEIGILSGGMPYLITTGRRVPAGTNGGISLLGTLSAVAGGCFIGACLLTFTCLEELMNFRSQEWLLIGLLRCMASRWKLVPIGKIAGLLGSMTDSLLGATLQYSGFSMDTRKAVSQPGENVKHTSGANILSNDAVNALSAFLTSMLAGWVTVVALKAL